MKLLSIILIIILFIILIYIYNYKNYIENFNDFNYGNYNLTVKNSNIDNRGVFSNKIYKKDDIIEICPYIKDKCSNFIGIISDYIFSIKEDKCGNAFGYFPLYNHSNDNNAYWVVDDDNSIVSIIAAKDINIGDEIFINYGIAYWDTRNKNMN